MKIIRAFSIEDVHDKMINELAMSEQRNVSSIVRLAIEEYYKNHKKVSE